MLDAGVNGQGVIVAAAVWTIILSVVAHGLTAGPFSSALGRRRDPAAGGEGTA